MGFNMLFIDICGEIYKLLNLHKDALVDLMVMAKGEVQELKLLPFGPCDGIMISSSRQLSTVLNPRGLMHMGSRVHHLDGFLFVVSCFSTIVFGLRFV